MDRPATPGRLAIGRIGAPRGIRGDLTVTSYSGEVEHFLGLREVELVPGPRPIMEGRPRSELRREVPLKGAAAARGITAARAAAAASATDSPSTASSRPGDAAGLVRRGLRLRVLRVESAGIGLTMAFEGYPTPESARALTGMDILVDRADAAPLGENEWYVADLVGLSLVPAGNPEGVAAFGRVVAVVEGGPDPWLETELPAGPRLLVPFRKEFVGEVDLEAGTIELLAPWILA